MYSIEAIYKKLFGMKTVKYEFDTDSYEEAMNLFDFKLRAKGITDDDIVNYSVTKTIHCEHCQRKIALIHFHNVCECGAVYDSFGVEEKEQSTP